MDQHPVPRQITTFEFKLIGFMTLKQFLYLVIFFPIGFIVYSIFPVPILNILLGILTGLIGVAFAFIPIQDRPMATWIKNLIKRVRSPTQYIYKKKNNPLEFLEELYYEDDPHLSLVHADTKAKLQEYLDSKKSEEEVDKIHQKKKRHVAELLDKTENIDSNTIKKAESVSEPPKKQVKDMIKQPFITGIVKNRRNIPLPGILVTIKSSDTKEQLRLLKTNPHGIFATYSPLPAGEYIFEASDPNDHYFFDTMETYVREESKNPVTIYSKEIL